MHQVMLCSQTACHSHKALGSPQGEQESKANLSARGTATAPVLLLKTTLVEPTSGIR